MTRRYTVAVSGASGAPYAVRLVELLARSGAEIDLTVTAHGLEILRDESGLQLADGRPVLAGLWPDRAVLERLHYYPADDMYAPIASGSCASDGLILCPCSMNTLAAVACGLSANLVQRAAQVALKERRPLVIVPREAPLAAVCLENMLRLARQGAVIVPAMPAFYHHPRTIADLVDFVVARVLNVLAVPHALPVTWSHTGE
jgi:flavin prenyltransferase